MYYGRCGDLSGYLTRNGCQGWARFRKTLTPRRLDHRRVDDLPLLTEDIRTRLRPRMTATACSLSDAFSQQHLSQFIEARDSENTCKYALFRMTPGSAGSKILYIQTVSRGCHGCDGFLPI